MRQLWTFGGFFLAGLAVNLTPCVYPMMTVTAALFRTRAAGQTLSHSFVKALAYVMGIVIMFSGLGYFAASTGKVFGGALQNSWVLGAVSLMMFSLALSMFGFFKLQVPPELLSRLGSLRKANYLGLFLAGMLVGIFAAPCIGPPVLVLLAAVANNGDPGFGLAAFFTFALGLGLPYLALGTFSSLVTKLPKAGPWLTWIERCFGMILLGFGVFYLFLALHVVLPKTSSAVRWIPYSQAQEELAKTQHKPVMIDFFAEWCPGCHELDRRVFSNVKMMGALGDAWALRVDATNVNSPPVQAVFDKYNVIGLPTVIFLDEQGQEVKPARMEGAVSAREFSKSLECWKNKEACH